MKLFSDILFEKVIKKQNILKENLDKLSDSEKIVVADYLIKNIPNDEEFNKKYELNIIITKR